MASTQNRQDYSSLYSFIIKLLLVISFIIIMLWFAYEIAWILLLMMLALALGFIINAPVTWFEKKGFTRFWSVTIVFAIIILITALLAWLIVPKISEQINILLNNIPAYFTTLSEKLREWLKALHIREDGKPPSNADLSGLFSSLSNTLVNIGNYSLSLIGNILVFLVFISVVIYTVISPRPLVAFYLSLFPLSKREKGANAFMKVSVMLTAWMRVNLIVGCIEAVSVTIFLSSMQIPGAWVWGALAFFAELIPRIGFYIMAVPPILVALSINPITAIWVTAFYLIMDEILGDFVIPKLNANKINLHPVASLFFVLSMGYAFGLMGALIATPTAIIAKVCYEEFYLSNLPKDETINEKVEEIIYCNVSEEKNKTS